MNEDNAKAGLCVFLRDGPRGSFRRGGRHQLRVWIRWVFPVLPLNAVIHELQEEFLCDGLLDASTHSWREQQHTHRLEQCTQLGQSGRSDLQPLMWLICVCFQTPSLADADVQLPEGSSIYCVVCQSELRLSSA